LKQCADENGFRTMTDDAINRVLIGQTTLEEIGRVVDLTDKLK